MNREKIVKLGKLEIDLEELAEFIARAKKNSYAGNGNELILSDGSKQLTFQEGNFFYEDNYAGFYQAPGSEIVRWQKPDGQRIWQMSYSGGMLPKFWGDEKLAKETFEFLKGVLSLVVPERPFRGPDYYIYSGKYGFRYKDNVSGDIRKFKGNEEITFRKNFWSNRRLIFSQDYIGGLVIPK